MTYDDGLLKIYTVSNTASPGAMPVEQLTQKAEYYFHSEQVGVTRYYEALEANQEVQAVVDIPGWEDIRTTDFCRLNNESEVMKVSMVQTSYDENNLKMTRLTLTKVEMNYELPG